MSLYDGLNEKGRLTNFGTRGDVCIDCLNEYRVENKKDVGLATKELKGKLEGVQVRRFPQFNYVICQKHILQMAAELNKKE